MQKKRKLMIKYKKAIKESLEFINLSTSKVVVLKFTFEFFEFYEF